MLFTRFKSIFVFILITSIGHFSIPKMFSLPTRSGGIFGSNLLGFL